MPFIAPPLRSVSRAVLNTPVLKGSSTTVAALPHIAPHNPYRGQSISTPPGWRKRLLVIPECSPPRRYKPYPRPQILSPGQYPTPGKRRKKKAKRRGSWRRLYLCGGVVQPPAFVCAPHPQHRFGFTAVIGPVSQTARDHDVEMDEAVYVPEDLVDVEMADDFLPLLVPAMHMAGS